MKQVESTIFYAILLSFSIALLVNGPVFTGLVVGQQQTETILINEIYSGFKVLSFELKGNLTSVKISGEFIGNGTGIVKANNLVLIDSRDLEKKTGNLITGMVVGDENVNDSDIEQLIEDYENKSQEQKEILDVVEENGSDEIFVVEEIIENENNLTTEIVQKNITNETEVSFDEILVNDTITNETIDINFSIEENISEEIVVEEEIENNGQEEDLIVEENISDETTNISINTSEEINLSVNETIEINVSIEENISEESDIENDENRISFSNYCRDTCLVQDNNELILIIALEDLKLNLTKITYTYNENDVPLEINLSLNNSENITTNISVNYTINQTNISLNISQNLTLNYSLNLTANETNLSVNLSLINLSNISINLTNITKINITNISLINETNITQNFSFIELNYSSDIERYNATLINLKLLYYETNLVKISQGNNVFTIYANNLSLLRTSLIDTSDERLSSKIFYVENSINSEINLDSDSADVILKCIQFNNSLCKQWQETNISFIFFNDTTTFNINSDGVYSVGKITPKKIDIIPTNSVYYNSNCDYCVEKYDCDAEVFCVMENAVDIKTTYIGQLDFDIFGLNNSWYKAEVCAHKSYSSGNVVNYIKYSPESFCSDIDNGNSTSDIISYKVVEDKSDLVCIDASGLLRYSQENRHSNLFVNWLGENLNGARFPFNCYYGASNKTNCQTNTTDCRPYLKLSYR